MKDVNLYKMKLHECIDLSKSISIMRVASGWIYDFYTVSHQMSGRNITSTDRVRISHSTFVPFSNHFQCQ